ncbi:MAG: glycosyltransferase family 9 protein [Bdellovibrionales bacterium]
MKVLIVQLARFGDVLLSAPSINSLKRTLPSDAEVHLLVRKRFSEIARFVKGVDSVKAWDTGKVLEPIIKTPEALTSSLCIFEQEVSDLAAEKYDKIINLSYSPFSSYLVSLMTDNCDNVIGYCRFEDGYLRINDDTSRFFYTQVGVDRPNRAHLLDVFAAIMDVHLQPCDKSVDSHWLHPSLLAKFPELQLGQYIIIHVGTSEAEKSVSEFKWKQIIRKSLRLMPNLQIVLVGSKIESPVASKILEGETFPSVVNLVGRTELSEVFALARHAKLVVGGDSLWMHIGSIVGTECLNLSFETVNFWETGPWSKGSEVLYAEHEHALPSDRVADVIKQHVTGSEVSKNAIVVSEYDRIEMYESDSSWRSFQWDMIKALYLGHEFPRSPGRQFNEAILRLAELTSLALENIDVIRVGKGDVELATQILNNVDQLFGAVAETCASIRPSFGGFKATNR